MLLSGSGSKDMTLGLRLFLKDEFSTPAANLTSALKGIKEEFNHFQETLKMDRNVSVALAAAGTAALYGMNRAIKSGAEFHYIMRGVEAISEGTNEQMDRLNKLAIGLGRETMFFPRDIASGMRFMAMAGQDAETIYGTITGAVNLAGATMTELGGKMGAADILTNALKAFGWEAEQSGRMADILTKATTSANVSLVDIGNSIRYVAATARNLKVPVEDTIGALMSLGNAGIQASMGGTALENMLRYLAMSMGEFATRKSQQAWAMMGIDPKSLQDAHGDFLPMVEILSRMRDGLKNLGAVQVQDIVRNIFGVRGQRAGMTLLRNLEEVTRFQEMLRDPATAGIAQEKMNLMMDSMQGAIFKLHSALDGLRASFTKAVEGPLKSLYRSLTWIIGGISIFMDSGIGKFITQLGAGLIAVITPVLLLRAAVTTLILAFSSFKAAVDKASIARQMMWQSMLGRTYVGMSASGKPEFASPGQVNPGHSAVSSTMVMGRSGAMERQYRDARGRFTIAPPIPGAAPRTSMALVGRGLATVGKGIFAFLGGWPMIAIMGISLAIPTLSRLLSRNSQAVDKNTEALKRASGFTPEFRELFSILREFKHGDVMDQMLDLIEALYKGSEAGRRALEEYLANNNMTAILKLLEQRGDLHTIFSPAHIPE
jgi:TP901 family phage tail tape measure protein